VKKKRKNGEEVFGDKGEKKGDHRMMPRGGKGDRGKTKKKKKNLICLTREKRGGVFPKLIGKGKKKGESWERTGGKIVILPTAS